MLTVKRAGAGTVVSTGPWSVYVLRCADGSLYTGIATDVARRLAEHTAGRRGAKCLRGRAPFAVVLRMEVGDRGLALSVERRIKALPKPAKERLLRSPQRRADLLAAATERERPDGRAAAARSRPNPAPPARRASARSA